MKKYSLEIVIREKNNGQKSGTRKNIVDFKDEWVDQDCAAIHSIGTIRRYRSMIPVLFSDKEDQTYFAGSFDVMIDSINNIDNFDSDKFYYFEKDRGYIRLYSYESKEETPKTKKYSLEIVINAHTNNINDNLENIITFEKEWDDQEFAIIHSIGCIERYREEIYNLFFISDEDREYFMHNFSTIIDDINSADTFDFNKTICLNGKSYIRFYSYKSEDKIPKKKKYSLEIVIKKNEVRSTTFQKSWINLETAKRCSKEILKEIIGNLQKYTQMYQKISFMRTELNDVLNKIDSFDFKEDDGRECYEHNSSVIYVSFKQTKILDPVMTWIPCSERNPTEGDCDDTNMFIVTIERQSDPDSRKYRIIDKALINSDYDNWLTRDGEKVVAWLPQVVPYIAGLKQPWEEETKDNWPKTNPALLQAWNTEKVVDENSQKSDWLDGKKLPLTRNTASYSTPISDKQIHIYFNSQDIPNEVDCIAGTLDGMSDAIKRGEPIIHTIQLIYCNMSMIYKYGYDLIIHPSDTESFIIDKNGCSKTNKDLKESHNLLKLLLAGTFCDMSKYTF